MSFLTRTVPRATTARLVAVGRQRPFVTSPVLMRGPVEAGKDALKTVDRKVSDKLVDGIEAGQKATQKVKETTGVGSVAEAKGKAAEVAGEAKGKAHEVAGQAKGKAEEIKGKM